MKRVLSFLYMLPFSLMALAGDRVPEMHKEWSTPFAILALVVGIIILVTHIRKKDDESEGIGAVGCFLVMAALMALFTHCVRYVFK